MNAIDSSQIEQYLTVYLEELEKRLLKELEEEEIKYDKNYLN